MLSLRGVVTRLTSFGLESFSLEQEYFRDVYFDMLRDMIDMCQYLSNLFLT